MEGESGFGFLPLADGGSKEVLSPQGLAAWYILSPHPESSWCLVGFRVLNPAFLESEGEILDCADVELSNLLDSALEYPPALALAREAFENNFSFEPTRQELADDLKDHLRQTLGATERQSFMAEAYSSDGDGVVEQGRYYWIVGYSPDDRLVHVVSRDCWVHLVEPTLFGFTPDFLRWRFRSGVAA